MNLNRLGGLMAASACAVVLISGCASEAKKTEAAATAPASAAAGSAASAAREYYIVLPENNRFYAFGDTANYFAFLAHSEVALTRTRIGAGPGGKTVVFGITKDDVKKNVPSTAELIFDGKLAPAPDFYGEVFKDGRYYVFGDLKDMKEFAQFGEVPYSFTDIGAGPGGATIVWVMNKTSIKKGRPTERMDRFKALRAAK